MINIKSIWESHKPTGDIIIKTRIDEITHISCFGATNHITGQHMFILAVSKTVSIPELKNYRFKGVAIFSIENNNTYELNIYLLDNDLKDIFSMFVQNILEEIAQCVTENEALNKTLNVVSKWKKLFDKINFNGLSLEEQKGLIGELLFLNAILSKPNISGNAIESWTGPEREFEAKDFTFGSIGVEIKFTTSKQPKILISNERQLDNESLSNLYLILYSTEAIKDNGFSLNSLIEQTRQRIPTEEELSAFNSKLQLYGYFDEHKDHYGKMYSLKKTFGFNVSDEFPKITKNTLPLGIYDISYSIEISSLENYIIDSETIINSIKK